VSGLSTFFQQIRFLKLVKATFYAYCLITFATDAEKNKVTAESPYFTSPTTPEFPFCPVYYWYSLNLNEPKSTIKFFLIKFVT